MGTGIRPAWLLYPSDNEASKIQGNARRGELYLMDRTDSDAQGGRMVTC